MSLDVKNYKDDFVICIIDCYLLSWGINLVLVLQDHLFLLLQAINV